METPSDSRHLGEGRRLDRVRIGLLIALLALAALAFRPLADYDPDAGIRDAVQGIEGWFFSPTGRSPAFIFGVAVILFFGRRRRLLAAIAAGRPEPGWAAVLLLLACSVFAWATYVGGPDLLVPALIPGILGSAMLVGGRGAALAILLPSLFLLLAVPPPAVLINQIVYPLQTSTAIATTAILDSIGVDALRSGDQILTRRGIFQVIESCTGLRTGETLLMSAILYGETLHRRWWWIGLLVLAVPLLAFIANQARVISIVFNPYSQVSEVHSLQGIIVLVGGVLAIAAFDALLARLLKSGRGGVTVRRVGLGVVPIRPLGAVVAFAAFLALASWLIQPWQPGPRAGRSLADFPNVLRGWKSEPVEVDNQYLGTVRFTERLSRRYKSPDAERSIDLFVGIDEHLQRNFSLLSDKTRVLGAGDEITDSVKVSLPPGDGTADLLTLRSGKEEWLALHWYRNVEPLGSEVFRSLVALDRSPYRRPVRSTVVRIATPLRSGEDAEEARSLLLQVAPDVRETVLDLEENPWRREFYQRMRAPRGTSEAG